jgi:TPR repeat protein
MRRTCSIFLAATLAAACAEPTPTPMVVAIDPGPCDLEVARAHRGHPEEQGNPRVCKAECKAGNLRSCVALELMQFITPTWPRSRDMATWRFGEACTAGVRAGCALLGELLSEDASNELRAAELLAGACEGGDTEGCYHLALLLVRDSASRCPTCRYVVPKDEARAAALFGKACSAGVPGACFELARLLEEGRGLAKDPAAAADLYADACEGGVPDACAKRPR